MDRILDFASPEASPDGPRLQLSRKVNVPRPGKFSLSAMKEEMWRQSQVREILACQPSKLQVPIVPIPTAMRSLPAPA